MLSDDELVELGRCRPSNQIFLTAARAIESAACAERDARIAELERQLAEARKDAERYLCLVRLFGVTKLPCLLEPVVGDYVADGKESLDAAIDAARAAIKEQT